MEELSSSIRRIYFRLPDRDRRIRSAAKDFEDRDASCSADRPTTSSASWPGGATTRICAKLPIWQFADTRGSLVDGLGVRSPDGVAYRYTFVVDPDNTIQHVYATNLNVGRSPKDTLRVLDALQTDELCPCNREVGGETLKVA